MKIIRNIPNFLTSMNLLFGSIAIPFIFEDEIVTAAWLIFFAALFDFLDGFVARLLNVKSSLGKELDSLSDLISFGLVPGLLAYWMMNPMYSGASNYWKYLPYSGFLITVFSAIRLAIFNLDDKQSKHFMGLPTPANALFFVSLAFVNATYCHCSPFYALTVHPWFLPISVVGSCFLMVAPLPMFSFKVQHFSLNHLAYPLIITLISIVFILVFGAFGLALSVVVYILISLIAHLPAMVFKKL